MLVADMASADSVTTYGRARIEITHGDRDGGTSGWKLDDPGADTRLGVKADKDLGNGLKAVTVMEWITELCGASGGSAGGGPTANLTTGAVNLNHGDCRQDFATARQMFIGLQGGFGRLAFGRFNGTYKAYGGVFYDPFVASSLQARARGGMSQGPFSHNAFMDDVVEYKSPKLGPVQFQLQYGLDNPNHPNGAKDSKSDFNVGIKAGDKNWEIIGAWSKDDSTSLENKKIGGKIVFGPVTVTLQYEDVEILDDGQYLFGAIVYKIGKFDVIGTFGDFSADVGEDGDSWTIGGKYHLGKKVFTYFGYSESDYRGTKQKDFTVGMRMDF